jgi:predicted HicB family RNase H-like nuclease
VPAVVPTPRRAPRPRSATGSKGKAAFTLRLDPDRHLKLRLACAVDGRSAQQLVTDALDHLLERMPDLDGLAAKAKRRG